MRDLFFRFTTLRRGVRFNFCFFPSFTRCKRGVDQGLTLCYGVLGAWRFQLTCNNKRNSLKKMMALLCRVCCFSCADVLCTKRAPRLRNVMALLFTLLSPRPPHQCLHLWFVIHLQTCKHLFSKTKHICSECLSFAVMCFLS